MGGPRPEGPVAPPPLPQVLFRVALALLVLFEPILLQADNPGGPF